jgi:hypothetical protein
MTIQSLASVWMDVFFVVAEKAVYVTHMLQGILGFE